MIVIGKTLKTFFFVKILIVISFLLINGISISQPPCQIKNDFIISRSICDPNYISFLSSASGYTEIFWDFGNGKSSSGLKNPSIKFDGAGNYTVTMILNFGSCIDTVKKIVTIDILNDNTLILSRDTTICPGELINLTSSQLENICWSPAIYLNDSSSPNPISTPKKDVTYSLISKINGENIIKNGDFSLGNLFFSSEYMYSPTTGVPEGVYFVGNEILSWHPSFDNCPDHTTGNGKMLLLNGSTRENIGVWKQTVSVIPNTNYEFSTWLQSLYPTNPAKLQFSINGINVGEIFEASSTTCEWRKFFTTWNSGNNTTAVISIVNKNTIFSGNDFAIDDIFFGTVLFKKDSVKIKVRNESNSTITPPQSICKGGSINLDASGGDLYEWEPKVTLNNYKIKNPIAQPTNTTIYTVKIHDTLCNLFTTLSTTISIKSFEPRISSDTSICGIKTIQLSSAGGNYYKWLPHSSLSNLYIPSPFATPRNTTRYTLIIKDTICNYSDTLTTLINVLKLPLIKALKSNDITCDILETQLFASGGIKYLWSPNSSLNNAQIANPIAKPISTTKYFLIGEGLNGCVNKDSIIVNVLSDSKQTFLVPNAFTPNNDRLNDCFGIKNWINIRELEFSIYNRWGELVYFTKNASDCWDGKYKGLMQDSGTFIYMIKAKTACSDSIYKQGTFLLIR